MLDISIIKEQVQIIEIIPQARLLFAYNIYKYYLICVYRLDASLLFLLTKIR